MVAIRPSATTCRPSTNRSRTFAGPARTSAAGSHDPLTIDDLSGAARRYPLVALTLSLAVLGLGTYVGLVAWSAGVPAPEEAPSLEQGLPPLLPTLRAGLYFLLPVVRRELDVYWSDYRNGRLRKFGRAAMRK